ncbi:MAG: hypothetical protein JJE23_03355 [Thermoleophilia bacterium]|nr:hypothetical protein [Thermoleophilia bacterium]
MPPGQTGAGGELSKGIVAEPGPRAQLVDPEERVDLLLRHLATRRDGLHAREAARRLEQYGSNEIRRWVDTPDAATFRHGYDRYRPFEEFRQRLRPVNRSAGAARMKPNGRPALRPPTPAT